MKRFLSWVVAWLGAWLFRVVAYWVAALILLVFYKMYGLSEVLFWVCIILGGSTVLSICGIGIVLGSQLVIKASQAVRKSEKGTRYTVLGICNIAMYALDLLLIITDVARASTEYVVAYIAAIIFGIATIIIGKQTVAEDGAPLSEVEELEAKLAKLKAKETSDEQKNSSRPMPNEFTYTVDEDYVLYLVNAGYGITEKDAREFCCILADFHNKGKTAALTRLDNYIEELSCQDVVHAVTISSFFTGLFVPNGVLTKEESDELSRSLTTKMFNKMQG